MAWLGAGLGAVMLLAAASASAQGSRHVVLAERQALAEAPVDDGTWFETELETSPAAISERLDSDLSNVFPDDNNRAQQEAPPALAKALGEVKTLVKVVAHSRARVVVSEAGCGLVFDAHSAFAGAVLVVRGRPVYQTVLPLFTVATTAPHEVT